MGGGYVGVDVFFVISGFLITGLLWHEVSTAGTIRLRRFYGARARRLLPASATVGVITAIGSAVLSPPLQAQSVLEDGLASTLYVSNYWLGLQGVNYPAPETPASLFQHYWSLGVQERFYLVWPAFIIGTAGRGGVVRAVASGHLLAGFCGVFFAAYPGLAVGLRRPGGPHRRPVAPGSCHKRRYKPTIRACATPRPSTPSCGYWPRTGARYVRKAARHRPQRV